MTRKWAIGFFIVATSVLVVVAIIMGRVSPKPNQGFTDTAAVLAVITGGAVGIERILEAVWTVVDMTGGAFWPLNVVSRDLRDLEKMLTDSLEPFDIAAKNAITVAAQAESWADDKLKQANDEIDAIGAQIAKLNKLAPRNLRAQLIAATAQDGIVFLQSKYPAINDVTGIASQAIQEITNVIASFSDNPGRRLMSIYFGAVLGLVGAGFLGLDVFQAILGQTIGERAHLGVVLTGIVIGLGSNPTHELIKVLQEIKQNKAAQNAQLAAQTGPSTVAAAAVPVPVVPSGRPAMT